MLPIASFAYSIAADVDKQIADRSEKRKRRHRQIAATERKAQMLLTLQSANGRRLKVLGAAYVQVDEV